MASIFVYTPRSGSKLIVRNPVNGMTVEDLPNGSHRVRGGSPQIDFYAAVPGVYWRGEACAAATAIVGHFGGAAWDSCGGISLSVPYWAEWLTRSLMTVVQHHCGHPINLNDSTYFVHRVCCDLPDAPAGVIGDAVEESGVWPDLADFLHSPCGDDWLGIWLPGYVRYRAEQAFIAKCQTHGLDRQAARRLLREEPLPDDSECNALTEWKSLHPWTAIRLRFGKEYFRDLKTHAEYWGQALSRPVEVEKLEPEEDLYLLQEKLEGSYYALLA